MVIQHIIVLNPDQWEVGVGTYSSNTLARTTVLASSNANALVNITASRSFVFITYAADKAVYKDGSERAVLGAGGIIFSDASVQTTAATSPDLSPYLTTSTADSTYLPLAGGTLTGDLLFTDATYDIGKSGATRPRDGFLSRNLTVGTAASINNSGLSARYSLNVGTSSFAGLVDSEVVAGFYNAVYSASNARVSVICGSGGEASLYLGDYSATRVKLTSAWPMRSSHGTMVAKTPKCSAQAWSMFTTTKAHLKVSAKNPLLHL